MVVGWDGKRIHHLSRYQALEFTYFKGTVNDDINFEYTNGADVNVGCGAILKGEYWYFGGVVSANRRQVSQGILLPDFF